jgi:NADH:ubiquinone oxidoreductase subunit E
MSKINRSMYPTMDSAHTRIDVLDETIVHYKAREEALIDMLQRIQEITEETE